ncbi:craniofacial development protein 2-like [Symsagittifera roscoffensis]|uniref:craniofacial development protein 2-like n=1 Tax=Symsagittifera roscoffensis TaxID=84072 RepID=UPI00307B2F48
MKLRKRERYRCEHVTDTKLKLTTQKPKHLLTVTNIYVPPPPTGILQHSLDELEEIYHTLNKLVGENKKHNLLYLAGDFHAKVGRPTRYTCIGRYSRGRTSNSSTALLEFCETNQLFIAKTGFQHRASHITTWESRRFVNGKLITLFDQIDCIACFIYMKRNLTNAGSYSGKKSDSGHSLVIARFNIRKYKLYRPKTERIQPPLNINRLVSEKNTREQYQTELEARTRKSERNTTWEALRKDILQAATSTLEENITRKDHNPEIHSLSQKQKDPRLKIKEATDEDTIRRLRSERSQILTEIQAKVKKTKQDSLDLVLTEIESTPDNAKMFKSVKFFL